MTNSSGRGCHSSSLHAPIQHTPASYSVCCCHGNRSYYTASGFEISKSTNHRGGRLSANTGPRHHKLAPNHMYTQGRRNRPTVTRRRFWFVIVLRGPRYLKSGCPHCLGKRATAGIPDRIGLTSLSCLSTWGCRLFLSPSGIRDKGLWSREGCGAGPNVHSTATSIRASATAGIPDRMAPCPALRLILGSR